MKTILILVLMLTLVGCKLDNNVDSSDNWSVRDFATVCLDGVQYYMRATGKQSYMAVRIDPETRMPSLCN